MKCIKAQMILNLRHVVSYFRLTSPKGKVKQRVRRVSTLI